MIKNAIAMSSLLAVFSLKAATVSSTNLQNIVFADPDISIVHGTDLTDPDVQAAMMATVGFSLSTTTGRRLAAYDTNGVGGADPDLEINSNDSPPHDGSGTPNVWAGGNLDVGFQLGLIAISQSTGSDDPFRNYVDPSAKAPVFREPNDNADGGVIIYNIAPSLNISEFTLITVDAENAGNDAYSILVNGTYSVDMTQNASDQGLNPFYGDRTINNLGTVDIVELSGGTESVITSIEYTILHDSGGAGGIFLGPVTLPVPEPSTSLALLLGGIFLAGRRRRS